INIDGRQSIVDGKRVTKSVVSIKMIRLLRGKNIMRRLQKIKTYGTRKNIESYFLQRREQSSKGSSGMVISLKVDRRYASKGLHLNRICQQKKYSLCLINTVSMER